MNTKSLTVGVAALVFVGSALAQAAPSTGKTRAEVVAELERDYTAGIYTSNRFPEVVQFPETGSRSREDVRKELGPNARASKITPKSIYYGS